MLQPNQPPKGNLTGRVDVNARGLMALADVASDQFGRLFNELTLEQAVTVVGGTVLGAAALDPEVQINVWNLRVDYGAHDGPWETADSRPWLGYEVPEAGLLVNIVRQRTMWEKIRGKRPKVLSTQAFWASAPEA